MASITVRRVIAPLAVRARTAARSWPRTRSCAARRRTPARSSPQDRRRSSSRRPPPARRRSRSSRGCCVRVRLSVYDARYSTPVDGPLPHARPAARCSRCWPRAAVVEMLVMSGAVAYSGRRCLRRRPRRRDRPTPGSGWLPSTGVTRCVALCPTYPTLADIDGVQQALGEDVPLLRELRPQVRIPRAHLAGRLVERPQRRRSRSPSVPPPVVASYVDGRLEEERRVERQPQVGARALHVLRDAVAAAHHPALAWPPGEAEPRLEALVVGLVERAALAAAVLREDLLTGRQVEVRLAVVLLDDAAACRPSASRGSA